MTIRSVRFLEAVRDASAGNAKIPKSEILERGQLAVVDQGKALVAGYTNVVDAAVKSAGPAIVFGDHTRAFKYIDFPFAMGADGVKVLQTRDGFDPKYVFRYLQSIEIPSAGYSRHFKFLKEFAVPKPSLEEQQRIAEILDKADALRDKRRQVLAHLNDLTQSMFHQMFGSSSDVRDGREAKVLEEWIDPDRPITYGILKPGPDIAGGVPYIRVADMRERGVNVAAVRRTTAEIAHEYRRSTLRVGDLLMSIRGHVGRLAFVPAELDGANITQDSARLAVLDAPTAIYVRAAIESPEAQRWMARRTKGAAVKGINLGDLRALPILVPPAAAMVEFASRVEALERLRAQTLTEARVDDELFASLRSRAFRGDL